MHQQALRTVLLIQAIEETDRLGEVIPLADRAEASRAAVRESGQSVPDPAGAPLSAVSETYIVRRAERLFGKLCARAPAVAQALALAGGFTWLGRIVLLIAFAFGASLAALDGSRRINILAFPLLGLIGWNLIVYVVLLLAWLGTLRRSRPPRSRASARAYAQWIGLRIESLLRRSTRFNVPLTNGLRRFVGEWSMVSQPLLLMTGKRLMHLAAALVAVGLIAGLYVRGIALRYEAGWESTFLGPRTAHVLVAILYGPAAALSGIPLASPDQIRALRWTGTGGGGEAASWIHLIALTAVLYIIIPRLLAAFAASVGLWRYSRRPPIPPSLNGYARSVILSVADGTVREVATVTPYAYEPARESLGGLELLLADALGGKLNMTVQDPIRYGDEEKVATTTPAGWNVLLMTLASTPEVENHGMLISRLRDSLAHSEGAAPLLVVVDTGPYSARQRGDVGFEERLQQRRKLWTEFVSGYGLRACVVDLTNIVPGSESGIQARDAARQALWTAGESA